ncbi:alpha/beta fold hydrolase [Sphingomonas immobilis]|uniref:Alpha/beta hydrolase n=1 Tax=Sphingomonas immobilis TaxID=3063997 RepID=A0ABT9A1C4_9SPHN|nr:alpha/beta hydrolase [Sphingomonas sp. CA1-15]MDO7843628.1 alpha/beta hydrolase [Sphingomonas sp. CA1-15]
MPAPLWFRDAIAFAPQRSTISVANAILEIEQWGAGRGVPLLLLHGHRANISWWHFTAPLLATDYDVTALGFSGMGGSSWRPLYTIETFLLEARAVAERLMEETGQKPVIIGHSLGGHIGAELAHHDNSVLSGLIIIDAGPIAAERVSDAPAAGRSPRELTVMQDRNALVSRFRPMPTGPGVDRYILDHVAEHAVAPVAGGWSWRVDPDLPSSLGAARAATRFSDLPCRVAQIHGAESPVMGPRDVARFLKVAPPGTPAVAIPAAGHHVLLEQPIAMVAAIRALLATHFAR